MRSKCALQMEKVRVQKDLPEIFNVVQIFHFPGGRNRSRQNSLEVINHRAQKQ